MPTSTISDLRHADRISDIGICRRSISISARMHSTATLIRRRRARRALTVIDHLFRCTVTWLAPMLCFTAEERGSRVMAKRQIGPPRNFPRGAGLLAERCAGRKVAQDSHCTTRGDRCAGDRARAKTHRLLAGSTSDRSRIEPRALRGGRRLRCRRGLHHVAATLVRDEGAGNASRFRM